MKYTDDRIIEDLHTSLRRRVTNDDLVIRGFHLCFFYSTSTVVSSANLDKPKATRINPALAYVQDLELCIGKKCLLPVSVKIDSSSANDVSVEKPEPSGVRKLWF